MFQQPVISSAPCLPRRRGAVDLRFMQVCELADSGTPFYSQIATDKYLNDVTRNWETLSHDLSAMRQVSILCSHIVKTPPGVTIYAPMVRRWHEIVEEAKQLSGRARLQRHQLAATQSRDMVVN